MLARVVMDPKQTSEPTTLDEVRRLRRLVWVAIIVATAVALVIVGSW